MCMPSCTLSDMDKVFLSKLDKLREYCGFPLLINCAYRSVDWDQEHGRSGNSYHCAGRAVDIRCLDSHKRGLIVMHAPYCGLNGIGIAKNFVHVDDRADARIWLYE